MATPKRNPRILWAIVIFLGLLFVVTYGERLATKAYLEASIVQQTARLAEDRHRNQALQQRLAYVRSDAYIEEAARNDLGMVQPGDELLIVVEGTNNTTLPTTTDASIEVAPPFWQEWLKKLGF